MAEAPSGCNQQSLTATNSAGRPAACMTNCDAPPVTGATWNLILFRNLKGSLGSVPCSTGRADWQGTMGSLAAAASWPSPAWTSTSHTCPHKQSSCLVCALSGVTLQDYWWLLQSRSFYDLLHIHMLKFACCPIEALLESNSKQGQSAAQLTCCCLSLS